MEELKNDNLVEQAGNEEPVIEQRPSTKYGRTAYQQQLQQEQTSADEEWRRQYAQSQYNPSQYNQTQYNQAQYNQPQYHAYTPYQGAVPEIKKVFSNAAMILVVICQVISCIANIMASEAYAMGNTIEEVMDALIVISAQPVYAVLITINDIAFWALVAVLVLDIMQLRKAGKKTKGAIAFAIFLRPAYFIWRAHLLGEKKTLPIIYAIAMYAISIVQYVILFQGAMEMVMRTM